MTNLRSRITGGTGAWLWVCLLTAGALGQQPAAPEPAADEPKAEEVASPLTPTEKDSGVEAMRAKETTCCPPSAMSKMADRPAGMAMMIVCMILVAGLLLATIAVLISLSIFLVRRSRPPAVVSR